MESAVARLDGDEPVAPQDEVDRIVADWRRERPDLDVEPLEVFSRVTRLARHLDRARRAAFSSHELDGWEFDVLSALRRAGKPYEMSPGALVTATLVTSGTMTNRIDRLEERGLVERHRSPDDRRGVLVSLTDEGRARLERFAHPFLREACLTAEAEIRAAAAAAEGRIRIEQTPDVDNDRLFDAIAERCAGKVVFVDFWNTWCTWCHVGFENFEPLKGGGLADKVVWLYIADESSPIAVYKKTIADLDGVHYRVTEEQMEAIAEKLGFDGFPFYMIIGRDGTRDTRRGLEYPATAEKRLREELQK